MQNNDYMLGSNWSGRTPRTLHEAGLRGSGGWADEDSVKRETRSGRFICLALLVVGLVALATKW